MKPSINFEVVPLNRLRRNPKAVKSHSDEQLEQLRASIQTFGFNDPIGVDADYQIIEGEGRYLAALELGLDEVPVVRLDHLSPAERDAYAIAHNQTQLLTGLDLDVVRGELGRLEVTEEEHTALGFSEGDILFLGFDDPTLHNDATLSEPAENTDQQSQSWNDLIQPIIKTNLRFTDRAKYLQFVQLIEALGGRYPADARPAGRLIAMVNEITAAQPH